MHDSEDGARNRISRRRVLQGSSLVLAGLAGCAGGDGGDGGDGGSPAGTAGDDGGIEGVRAEWWDILNVQSDIAKNALSSAVDNFNSETGANLQPGWYGYGDVIGAKWLNSFKQGNYPAMYTSVAYYNGGFIDGGWLKPFEEYRDQFTDEELGYLDWILPLMEQKYRGYDGVMEIPWGIQVNGPFVARMDHFEAAGLDPEEDFPPENYQQIIDIGTTLQEDGPGQWGFQVHGSKFDVTDAVLPIWAVARGGKEGLNITEDWSDTHIDNEVWKDVAKKYVDIFVEHELSSPATPNAPDEDAASMLASGEVSMSQFDFLNRPVLADKASDLIEDGTIRWGESWGGESGIQTPPIVYTLGITRPPEGADEEEWQRKQQVGIEFAKKTLLSEEFQKSTFDNFGFLPVRKDVWDDLPELADNGIEVTKSMLEGSDIGWYAHPQMVNIQYNLMTPPIQKALQGEISAAEAMDQAAEKVRTEALENDRW